MTTLLMIIGAVAIGLGIGLMNGKKPKDLTVRVDTYGGSNAVDAVELVPGHTEPQGYYLNISNSALGKHERVFGSTLGTAQYRASRTFKAWASAEMDRKYSPDIRYPKWFTLPVTMNGEQMTDTDYARLTNSRLRSRKNPIKRIWYEKGGPPLYGTIEHVERYK